MHALQGVTNTIYLQLEADDLPAHIKGGGDIRGNGNGNTEYNMAHATHDSSDFDQVNVVELIIHPREQSTLKALYDSLSECASLHPDNDGMDDDEVLGPGDDETMIDNDHEWITAENVDDQSAAIEVTITQPLQAGIRRTRDITQEDEEDVNNDDSIDLNDESAVKWRRTDP